MRRINFLGSIFFIALIIQAWSLNLEKSVFGDSAFYVFQILQFKKVPVEHFRFVGSLFSLPAYLGMLIGLKLSLILKLYAIGIWVLLFGVFKVLVRWEKKHEALIVLASSFWFVRESFIITSEVPVAIGISVLFHAILYDTKILWLKQYRFPLIFLTSTATLLTHPFALFFLLVIVSMYILFQQDILRQKILVALTVAFSIGFKFLIFPQSQYDQGSIQDLFNGLKDIGNISNFYSYFFLTKAYDGFYLLSILMYAYLVFRFIEQKEIVKAIYVFVTIGLLILLTLIQCRGGDVNPMMEKNFQLFLFPLIYFFVLSIKMVNITNMKIGLLFWVLGILSLQGIINRVSFYSDRLYKLDNLVNQIASYEGSKFVVADSNFYDYRWSTRWALPYETLILSSLKTPESAKTLKNGEDFIGIDTSAKYFFGADFAAPLPVNKLNTIYFKLDNSSYIKK
jgi:hypothetical protein